MGCRTWDAGLAFGNRQFLRLKLNWYVCELMLLCISVQSWTCSKGLVDDLDEDRDNGEVAR